MNRKKNKSKKNKSRPFTAIYGEMEKLDDGEIIQYRGFKREIIKSDPEEARKLYFADRERGRKRVRAQCERYFDYMTWPEEVTSAASWAEAYLAKQGLPTGELCVSKEEKKYSPREYVQSQGYDDDTLEYTAACILELAPRLLAACTSDPPP